jgi:hypothetical protein
MSSRTPFISTEVTRHIIDYLEDDFTLLKAASLVCRDWQYPSQKLLFQALTLDIIPQDSTVGFLENLISDSASRVRGYVRHIRLQFSGHLVAASVPWLRANGRILVQVVKMLPLDRLTDFTLKNGWIPFSNVWGPPSVEFTRCIGEICAAPKLNSLMIFGDAPFAQLLASAGPSLTKFHTTGVGKTEGWRTSTNPSRLEPITLKVLTVGTDIDTVSPRGLSDYVLDSTSLISLACLRELQFESRAAFNKHLSRIIDSCIGCLEALSIDTMGRSSNRLN